MKLKISIENRTATALLYDNLTSRDFAARLPMVLELEDYNGTEKINLLSHPLTSEGSPKGYTPSAGDITYYEPWGNMAFFYKDFGYANGLIALGKITSGLEILNSDKTVTALIELESL